MSDSTTESEQKKDSFIEQAFSDWFVENMYGNDPVYAQDKAKEAFEFAYNLANESGKDSASGVRVNTLVSWLKKRKQYHGIVSMDAVTPEKMEKHNLIFEHLKYVIELIENEYEEAN